MPPMFMKPLWILASRRGIAQRLRDETTQIIHYLSSLIPGRQQKKKKKLIINHSNKLGMFFTLSPRSPCQLMFFWAVGVIPAGETNHLSSSCRRLSSFIISANQLSIVVSQNLSCVSFSSFFFFLLSLMLIQSEIWAYESGIYHRAFSKFGRLNANSQRGAAQEISINLIPD